MSDQPDKGKERQIIEGMFIKVHVISVISVRMKSLYKVRVRAAFSMLIYNTNQGYIIH